MQAAIGEFGFRGGVPAYKAQLVESANAEGEPESVACEEMSGFDFSYRPEDRHLAV